jgi:hypothetical protein
MMDPMMRMPAPGPGMPGLPGPGPMGMPGGMPAPGPGGMPRFPGLPFSGAPDMMPNQGITIRVCPYVSDFSGTGLARKSSVS